MKHKNVTRNALFTSIVSLLVCLSMLVGTTFAWFTDSVESDTNIITSGNLDVEMYWADGTEAIPTDDSGWTDASTDAIFDYDKWEPGYTVVRHIKIANEGSLALKYQLNIKANGEVSDLAEVIDVYFVDPAQQIADRAALAGADVKFQGQLSDVLGQMPGKTSGTLAGGQEVIVTVALKMQESANNDYMAMDIGTSFSVVLLATQLEAEYDSFGPDYDENADYNTGSTEETTEATEAPVEPTETTAATEAPCDHSGDDGKWESDDNQHYYKCDDCDVPFNANPHTEGTKANCIAAAVCDVCELSYGSENKENHVGSASEAWESDGTNHWQVCACSVHLKEAPHNPGEWEIDTNGERFQSCTTCGMRLDHTHVYDANKWEFDENGHFHKCTECGTEIGRAPHAGGTYTPGENGQHYLNCATCGEPYGHAPHSGGVATCEAAKVCEDCNQPYGDKDPQNHVEGRTQKPDLAATHHDEGRYGLYCDGCDMRMEDGGPIDATGHCICNGTAAGKEGHTCDTNIEWIAWTAPDSLPTADGKYYYLTEDVTLTGPVTIAADTTLNLCLNGQTVSAPGQVFILDGGTLNITDCEKENGEYKGTVMGNTEGDTEGDTAVNGGVFSTTTTQGSTLNIFGGNYQGNKANYAGVAYMNAKSVTMNLYAGKIFGGTSSNYGGNIYMGSGATLNMYGGTITGGYTTKGAGNVAVNGGATFNLHGGTVSNGTAVKSNNAGGEGGNIRIASGSTLNMYGGTVTGGSAESKGPDIHNGNKFNYYGGTYDASKISGTAPVIK